MQTPPADALGTPGLVSVVIPTFNEAETLPRTLRALSSAAGGQAFEVIVSDGGSDDHTLAIARAWNCVCVQSPRAQRAAQMNAGAARACGDVLLFLHADTLLPIGALEKVWAACRQPGIVGGGFVRRYDSPSRWLRLTCWLAERRNRWFGWHLGDQAIFVRRSVFERLGGFRDFDVFEDVDFSRRLARAGKLLTLRPPVVSSARRFASRGVFRRSLLDAWLMWRYLLGASPPVLQQARAQPQTSSLGFRPVPIVPAVQPVRRDTQDVQQQEQGVG